MTDQHDKVTPEALQEASNAVGHHRASLGDNIWCVDECPACALDKAAEALEAVQAERDRVRGALSNVMGVMERDDPVWYFNDPVAKKANDALDRTGRVRTKRG
jgi:hypothetical protein